MSEQDIIELMLHQKNNSDLIRKFTTNTNKTGKANQTKGFLQGRLTLLEKYWAKFDQVHDKILTTPDVKGQCTAYIKSNTYDEIELIYAATLGSLNDAILDLETKHRQHGVILSNNESQDFGANLQIKLPPIALPKFSGDFSQWPSFHDLFDSLVVKNTSLSKVNKLHHLKSSLSGEAELVIRQFAIEENNFDPAWALLKRRFANKRMLINAQFSRILSQQKIQYSNPDNIRRLLDTSTESITSIKSQLKIEERFDALLIYILTQKLDTKTIEMWEQSITGEEEFQTFESFSSFLENHCRTQELVQSASAKPSETHRIEQHRITKSYLSANSSNHCVVCNKENHSVFRCYKFKRLSVQERYNVVRIKGLCTRCLSSEHNSSNCPNTYLCFKCNEAHNTLLHQAAENIQVNNASTSSSNQQTSTDNPASNHDDAIVYTHHGLNNQQSQTLLATAQVHIRSKHGKIFQFRALIDPGSQACLITRNAVNLLQLKIEKCNTTVRGLGATVAGVSNHLVNFVVTSIHNKNLSIAIEAIVMPKLTDTLPSNNITVSKHWDHLKFIPLADPTYYKSEKIDLILGADVYHELILPDIRKGPVGAPIAQNTTLGWILIGKLFNSINCTSPSREVVSYIIESSVCEQLQKFWEIEEISDIRISTKEDQLCELHFQNTHSRKENGRYCVDLPFNTKNNTPPTFGNTRNQAFLRFCQVERRLKANPDLQKQYKEFMNEYIQQGHMHPVQQSSSSSSFYLPHHAIVKPTSISTKLRVVFDASAKDSNGIALNETFRIGPTIQQDLLSILLRWRKHRYAITSDVEKMYRQIEVNVHHQPYQRIIWRNEENMIVEYELSTVTYGTACAPFLAIRTLHQLAQDERTKYPEASKRTFTDMYVDDFISGGDTLSETIEVQRQMSALFKEGGFNLRKWSSNAQLVLDNIQPSNRESSTCLDVCRDDVIKTLGVFWHTINDEFQFKVNTSENHPKLTKRNLLSDVAKLFDPFGFLAPVIITAKIIFQSLWLRGLDWDDQLPQDITNEWIALRTGLHEVANISIPRWLGTVMHSSKTEFHGFCDASNKAYAAVIFCRTIDGDQYKVHLLTSKTKVAPIKKISLPNLELCGATLLAKLMKKVQLAMDVEAQLYAWTDSTIVLDWIKSNSHKQTFVANRVSTILDHTKPSYWRHVRSKENPADIASRGICPTQLKNYSLWWHGPTWLQQDKQNWPNSYTNETSNHIIEVQTNHITAADTELPEFVSKFSSWNKLIRVITRCLKFVQICRSPDQSPTIGADDFRDATNRLIRLIQTKAYSDEIKLLNDSKSLNKSKIASLCPFICKDGLIRVGGRLRNADIKFDHKHPILLPREYIFTKLLVDQIHKSTLHGGLKLTLATIRQKYWIPNARTLIRTVIHECVKCRRFSNTCHQQLMGSLPASRVTQSKVFSHTGVDYAGPFDLRLSKHRGRGTFKGFVAVFICLSTKAIHLELASDLTTKSFLAALKRFISRRGICSDIYSDNGTNFVGANREIQTNFDATIRNITATVAESMAIDGISWHFIPANSPHFGGLWEAGVKSFKHHLRRILENTTLTYEEFYTLLTEIEASLNSRPLCPLSSDPNDIDALTPGHFLIGGPLNAIPEPSLLSINENRMDRWQYLEKLNQTFWNSWTVEYLSELQQRPKRLSKSQENLKKGDIVIVKDIRLAPTNWPLGRVIATHAGSDGLVRAVTLKLKNGETKRAINKLCRLPIDSAPN